MAELPPIRISLTADGIDNVKTSLQSVEQALKRFEENSTRIKTSGASKRVSATDKEAKAITRAHEQESRKREARAEKEFREVARQAKKWADEEIRENKKKQAQLEADSKRSAQRTSDFFRNAGSSAMGVLGRVAGAAGKLAATFAALGGGYGLADSLGKGVKNNATARMISINSGGLMSKQFVYDSAKGIANTNGFSTEESLNAIDAFTAKAGYDKPDVLMKVMPQLAELANATGASFDDMASAAGIAFGNDKKQSAEDLMRTMRKLAQQGRAGAVDMRDLATSLSRVTSTARQFSGNVNNNIATLGALTQLSMQAGTSTSAAEATESVASLSHDIAHNRDKFRAKGIDTEDGNQQLLDPRSIIMKSIGNTNGNQHDLQKMFGLRSFRAVEGLARTFQSEYAKSKTAGASDKDAKKSALDATNKMLDELEQAELSREDVKKQAALRMEEADKKLAVSFNVLRDVVADNLVPYLIPLSATLLQLVPVVQLVLDGFIDLVKWINDNPFEAAIAGLGAALSLGVISAVGSGLGPALLAAAPLIATPVGAAIAAAIAGVVVTGVVVKIRLNEEDEMAKNANEKARAVLNNPNATQEDRNKALANLHDVDKKTGTWSGRLFGRAEMNENDAGWQTAAKATIFNPMNLSTSFIAAGFGDSKVDSGVQKQLQEQYKSHLTALEQDKINLIENTIAMKSLTGALQLFVGKIPTGRTGSIDAPSTNPNGAPPNSQGDSK